MDDEQQSRKDEAMADETKRLIAEMEDLIRRARIIILDRERQVAFAKERVEKKPSDKK